MTIAPSPTLTWQCSAPDGIACAFAIARPAMPSLCGHRLWAAPRHVWPTRGRCIDCIRIADRPLGRRMGRV